jgi:hypothetical protein
MQKWNIQYLKQLHNKYSKISRDTKDPTLSLEYENTANSILDIIDRYYEMEMLKDFYHGVDPIELLNRAYFGHDHDTWATDASGNKRYGEFNPNRDYFYYNGYGNLVSSDYKDYSVHLDSYAIEEMSENRQYIDTIDDDIELSILFDELEDDE